MAATDLNSVPEPDETGTDTFRRYRYQAEVAFQPCLRCAEFGDVLSVTPERIEDLLVEEQDRWRFIQVKTRDAALGPWLYGDLLAQGGALRSIVRTHEAIAEFDDGREVRYEVHLEGAAKRGDAIENVLLPRATGATAEMVTRCADRLRIGLELAEAVLARTRVRDQLPPRELIRDRNIRDLQRFAGDVLPSLTESVYDAVIDLIEAAMRAELLAEEWPHCVLAPESAEAELAARVASKRLEAERLVPLFAPLGDGNRALLELVTDPDALTATDLERKLVAAGATDSVRNDAKQLRANTTRVMFESERPPPLQTAAALADLDMRLLVAARAVAGTTTGTPTADVVWKAVLDDFTAKRETLDPALVLSQDPMLLTGRLCELSDLCQFAWGL